MRPALSLSISSVAGDVMGCTEEIPEHGSVSPTLRAAPDIYRDPFKCVGKRLLWRCHTRIAREEAREKETHSRCIQTEHA